MLVGVPSRLLSKREGNHCLILQGIFGKSLSLVFNNQKHSQDNQNNPHTSKTLNYNIQDVFYFAGENYCLHCQLP